MTTKQIVKTERCPGCIHCAQNYVEDDELVILCDLEMDGYEEAEGEKCEHYSLTASKKSDEPVDEGDQDDQVAYGSDDPDSGYVGGRKIVTAKIHSYVFVGDKLSEIKNPKEGQEFVELDAAFADAWNLKIEQAKEDLAKGIEAMEAGHVELLAAAKEELLSGNFVTVDELFDDDLDDEDDEYEDDEDETWETEELDGDGPEDDEDDEEDEKPVKPVAKTAAKKPAKKTAPKKPVKKPTTKKK